MSLMVYVSFFWVAHKCTCPQMSLWELSFVTKQSHVDGGDKKHSHMLSHRLRIWTCDPYVCLWLPGFLSFFCFLCIQKHTQTFTLPARHARRSALNVVESCCVMVWCRVCHTSLWEEKWWYFYFILMILLIQCSGWKEPSVFLASREIKPSELLGRECVNVVS